MEVSTTYLVEDTFQTALPCGRTLQCHVHVFQIATLSWPTFGIISNWVQEISPAVSKLHYCIYFILELSIIETKKVDVHNQNFPRVTCMSRLLTTKKTFFQFISLIFSRQYIPLIPVEVKSTHNVPSPALKFSFDQQLLGI